MTLSNQQAQAAAAAITSLQGAEVSAAMLWFGSTQVTIFGNGMVEVSRTGMNERFNSLAEFKTAYIV